MTYPGIENDAAAVAENPDRVAVEERRKAQEEEFGTYVAEREIPWGSVTAFFPGEPVPKSTVERYGWLDLGLVSRVGGQPASDGDAKTAAEKLTGPPPDGAAKQPAERKTGGNS